MVHGYIDRWSPPSLSLFGFFQYISGLYIFLENRTRNVSYRQTAMTRRVSWSEEYDHIFELFATTRIEYQSVQQRCRCDMISTLLEYCTYVEETRLSCGSSVGGQRHPPPPNHRSFSLFTLSLTNVCTICTFAPSKKKKN